MKHQRFAPFRWKYASIRKFEFVAKLNSFKVQENKFIIMHCAMCCCAWELGSGIKKRNNKCVIMYCFFYAETQPTVRVYLVSSLSELWFCSTHFYSGTQVNHSSGPHHYTPFIPSTIHHSSHPLYTIHPTLLCYSSGPHHFNTIHPTLICHSSGPLHYTPFIPSTIHHSSHPLYTIHPIH